MRDWFELEVEVLLLLKVVLDDIAAVEPVFDFDLSDWGTTEVELIML